MISKGSLACFSDVSDQVGVEDVRDRYVDKDIDLIIAEGWKSEGFPKIVVIRDRVGEVPVSPDGLLAVVSNNKLDLAVPCLHPDDIPAVAELVMRHFPKRHEA